MDIFEDNVFYGLISRWVNTDSTFGSMGNQKNSEFWLVVATKKY